MSDGRGTWTFCGHWENDQIVVEYVFEGEVEDRRIDTGYWNQGLFAAWASGETIEEAETAVRREYEEDEDDEDDECGGHPAGPSDPMGVTVYCDGSCA
jgi:hypothetical protein